MAILLLLKDQEVYQEILMLADELFPKSLRRFETCLLVNNTLCRKLFSSSKLPVIFDDSLKIASI